MNKFFVRKGSEGGITEKLTDIYASLCLEHRPSSESKNPVISAARKHLKDSIIEVFLEFL